MTAAQIKGTIKKCLRTAVACSAPLFGKKSEMTPEAAREKLLAETSRPAGTGMGKNILAQPRCDLQIVVPAYNVENYLADCMESILSQQTRYSYHVVLVDDGAKDSTPQICDRYADHPNVTVIHQANRGLSGARNTGMGEIFGRYLLFVDSDDLLPPGSIEGLVDTAYAHDCDLVEGGAYYLKDGSQTVMHRYEADRQVENPYATLHGHAWGKLYRAELFENRCFPEGYWYEDSLISFLIFPAAKNIWVSAQMGYAYRINQSGIVKASVGKPRAVETYWITEQMLKERQAAGLPFDGAFFDFLLLQIRLNHLRVSDLDEKIQESVFVLTCDLMERYFPQWPQGKERNLVKALKTRDFGMFRMCCKFF